MVVFLYVCLVDWDISHATVHWYNIMCLSTEYILSVVRSFVYCTYDVGSMEYIISIVRSSMYCTMT